MLVGVSYEPVDTELKQLIDRWVAQWNEPSPGERRRLIGDVWAEDGYQIMVNPPQGIRGYDAMYARVTRAYEMFIADGEHVFERQGAVVRHAGATVALTWVMRSRADGSIAGSGLDVLTFGPDGRVHTDHQFVA